MSSRKRERIALVGFMATGKTAFGRILAKKLGWSFIDCDAVIERRERMKIARIFARKGEPYFRRAESAVLAASLKKKRAVISTGGGAVISAKNRRLLKRSAFVVWMRSPLAYILKRAGKSPARPLLNAPDRASAARRLLKTRTPLYEDCADVAVWTRAKSDLAAKAGPFLTRNSLEKNS
jgi:shikimate kinase